jgi:hypothetical protein
LHNYHEAIGRIPQVYVWENWWGWNVMLLPYLDQAPLYNSLASKTGTSSWYNTPAVGWGADPGSFAAPSGVETNLSVVRCPSDTGSNVSLLTNDFGTPNVQFGRSNYFGVMGSNNVQPNGAFPYFTSLTNSVPPCRSFRDFTDGLSNSFLVGERRSAATLNGGFQIGGEGTWVGYVASNSHFYTAAYCFSNYPLNWKTTSANDPGFPNPGIAMKAFSSAHTGGGHFLMGDCAVRFISDNIDLTTYANLAGINDGQVLGEF